ncbi:MAG: peptide transporter [Anaerolineaceae bacterium]|nr:peptide transporter [Anaerolineaceae bacterium]
MTTTLAVLNQKGGAGKTTLSTNIACQLQLNDYRVLLVDSDPQGSARDWHAASDGQHLPVVGLDRATLDRDIKAITKDYDWVVIDGAPQLREMAVAAIKAADVILIPVQPSPYDIWACSDLVELIKSRQEVTDGRPKTAFVISRVIQGTKLSKEVREALAEYGLPVFEHFTSQRVIYPNSAASGSTPMLMEPSGEGAKEVQRITRELNNFITGGITRGTHSEAAL